MSTLSATLWISLISIVLLFAAMAVIWGLMGLLARSPDKSKETAAEPSAPSVVAPAAVAAPAQLPAGDKPKAAALAVSIALALRNRSQRMVMKDAGNGVSTWQTVRNVSRVSQRNQLFARK